MLNILREIMKNIFKNNSQVHLVKLFNNKCVKDFKYFEKIKILKINLF